MPTPSTRKYWNACKAFLILFLFPAGKLAISVSGCPLQFTIAEVSQFLTTSLIKCAVTDRLAHRRQSAD
jgi:hypothetical protein